MQGVNLGNAPTSGTVTLSDVVPAGMSVQSVSFYAFSSWCRRPSPSTFSRMVPQSAYGPRG